MTEQGQTESLYRISLAISPCDTAEETAETALSSYLDHLGCSAGAVLAATSSADGQPQYQTIATLPADRAETPALQTALARLSEADTVQSSQLPLRETGDAGEYTVMALPGFGALVLAGDGVCDEGLQDALPDVNQKLAAACRQSNQPDGRFEALFEALQEPAAAVVSEDDEPIVRRINPAFERTFGYAEGQAIGENLDDLVGSRTSVGTPDGTTRDVCDPEADPPEFRVQTIPVDAAGVEGIRLFADVTSEQVRQHRLERLYEEAMTILPEADRNRVAEQAVATAADIVDISIAGIHLYERSQEALVPVATTSEATSALDGGPDAYTDHETVIWEVYRSGEPVIITDVSTYEGKLPREETPVNSAVVLPLGDHGVFIASSLERDAFDPTEVGILRLFSTLVEIALDRSQREQGLEGIQEITRTALGAESHEAVAEVAMQRVPDLLDLPLSAVWRYDATADALRPIAWTEKAEQLFDEISTFDSEGSLVWRAFKQRQTYVIPDVSESDEAYNGDTPIGSEIVVPLGDFGVMVTGSTRAESFADPERRLVETLAANLETALRLIDRRQELDLLDQVLARILRHNIRNELNIIQGYASQIVDTADGEIAAQAQKIIKRCYDLETTAEHAREMREIVRSREQRASVSLQQTVEQAVSMVQLENPAAEISLDSRASPLVVAHPDLMTAIRHLLENSINHHDGSDGHPIVDVRIEAGPEQATLTIRDNGPGIPRSEIEILDQHGESALEHGSGAGLWIIDRVIQYSGAAIEYERLDDGTLVTIEFTLAE